MKDAEGDQVVELVVFDVALEEEAGDFGAVMEVAAFIFGAGLPVEVVAAEPVLPRLTCS